jgi:hypothetical protein
LGEILSPRVSDFCCLIGLGATAFFRYLVSMCWWRVAMFGLWHPESLCLCFLPQCWSGYGLGMSMMTGSVFYYSLRMSLT